MSSNIRLVFVENHFTEGKTEGDIILDLDEQNQKAILIFAPGVANLLKRTVIRQARSIVKTGFLLASGARVGRGLHLEIRGEMDEELSVEVSDVEFKSERPDSPFPWEKSLEEDLIGLTRFFWEDLRGRTYGTWKDIPATEQTLIQRLLHLGKGKLTNEELRELFVIRAENDRERFQERAWLLAKAHKKT